MESITTSSRMTEKLAGQFAKRLKPGLIVGLIGELGSGKTVFVRGLAKGIGIKTKVVSPTFILMRQYQNLVHFDFYRVKSVGDALTCGLKDFLGKKDYICVVEWADKIKKILPKDTIIIKFEHIAKNKRRIIIEDEKHSLP